MKLSEGGAGRGSAEPGSADLQAAVTPVTQGLGDPVDPVDPVTQGPSDPVTQGPGDPVTRGTFRQRRCRLEGEPEDQPGHPPHSSSMPVTQVGNKANLPIRTRLDLDGHEDRRQSGGASAPAEQRAQILDRGE